jgi:hypothetical protein
VSRFVAHARKTGEVDAKADPNLIGMLVVSAYLTVLIEWISDDPAPFTLSEKVATAIDLLLEGALTAPNRLAPHRPVVLPCQSCLSMMTRSGPPSGRCAAWWRPSARSGPALR